MEDEENRVGKRLRAVWREDRYDSQVKEKENKVRGDKRVVRMSVKIGNKDFMLVIYDV